MRRRYGNEGQISSEIPFRYLCPFEVVHFPPPTSSINRPNPISHCIALVEILHTSWSYWCSEFIILLIPYISQHVYQIFHAIKTLQSSELSLCSKQIISYSTSHLVVAQGNFSQDSEFIRFSFRCSWTEMLLFFCRWFTILLKFALPLSS